MQNILNLRSYKNHSWNEKELSFGFILPIIEWNFLIEIFFNPWIKMSVYSYCTIPYSKFFIKQRCSLKDNICLLCNLGKWFFIYASLRVPKPVFSFFSCWSKQNVKLENAFQSYVIVFETPVTCFLPTF